MLQKLDNNKGIAEGRLQALLEDIHLWRDQEADPDSDELHLTERFAEFCDEVFHYARIKYARLKPDDAEGHGLALRSVTELLQAQWMIVRETLQQQQGVRSDYVKARSREAQKYYEQFRSAAQAKGVNIPSARLYVYLDELPSLTRLIVPGFGLIATPLFATHNSWEIQAIPHEVAHYILHITEGLLDELRTVLRDALARAGYPANNRVALIWDAWCEEVGADMIGTLFAGVDHAIGIQHRLLGPTEAMAISDGRHPLPYLRPFIHIYILKLLGQHNEAEALAEQWQNRYSNYQNEFYQAQVSGFIEFIKIKDLINLVDNTIHALCKKPLQSLNNNSLFDLFGRPEGGISSQQETDSQAVSEEIEQFTQSQLDEVEKLIETFISPVGEVSEDQLGQIKLSEADENSLDELESLSVIRKPDKKDHLILTKILTQDLNADMQETEKFLVKNKEAGLGALALVTLAEDRKILAKVLVQAQGLAEDDPPIRWQSRLNAWAIYKDLQRDERLSAEQALELSNRGFSLTSLRHVHSARLAKVLNISEDEASNIQKWASGAEARVICQDKPIDNLITRQAFWWQIVVGVGAALALKVLVG